MRQISLFENLPQGEALGLAGVMPSIRAAMNRLADKHPAGRKGLVDLINEVAEREGVALTPGGGKKINLDILNKWLQSGERGHAPSLAAILCFCAAAGEASPVVPILKMFGLAVVSAEELKLLEYGRTCATLRDARERKRKLEAGL